MSEKAGRIRMNSLHGAWSSGRRLKIEGLTVNHTKERPVQAAKGKVGVNVFKTREISPKEMFLWVQLVLPLGSPSSLSLVLLS